jgi:hypothetical protein
MTEPSFVTLYVREFFNLAGRSADSAGLEDTLARKVSDVRQHAIMMDARKGGSHLDAVASALEAHAALPAGHSFRQQAAGEWESRAAFLRRSAELLRGPVASAPRVSARAERLALRTPA